VQRGGEEMRCLHTFGASNTNLRNRGLNLNRSSDKADSHAYNTPFHSKSSTKDLSLPTLEIVWQQGPRALLCMMWGPEPYRYSRYIGRGGTSSLSSMDSDLEAFSHNPTDGSFGALAVQPTP
jgi:hypothetical protein